MRQSVHYSRCVTGSVDCDRLALRPDCMKYRRTSTVFRKVIQIYLAHKGFGYFDKGN